MKVIVKGIDSLLFLLVMALTLVVFLNIVFRPVFSLTWSGELAGILLMWIVYFGLMNSFYHKAHVQIDIVDEVVRSKKIKNIIQFIFYNILGLAFGIYFSIFSFRLFQNYIETHQQTVILRWPLYIVVIPFVIGGVLTTCYFLTTVIKPIVKRMKKNA